MKAIFTNPDEVRELQEEERRYYTGDLPTNPVVTGHNQKKGSPEPQVESSPSNEVPEPAQPLPVPESHEDSGELGESELKNAWEDLTGREIRKYWKDWDEYYYGIITKYSFLLIQHSRDLSNLSVACKGNEWLENVS